MFFFFNDSATNEIYTYLHTLSLHDALPFLVSACSFGSDEGLIWFVMRRSLLPFRLDSRCRSKRSSLLRSGMRVLVHRSRDRRRPDLLQIGRASCRERVCQYVWISVVAVSLKKKNNRSH